MKKTMLGCEKEMAEETRVMGLDVSATLPGNTTSAFCNMSIGAFGTTRKCAGAHGAMSLMAMQCSSSCKIVAGI